VAISIVAIVLLLAVSGAAGLYFVRQASMLRKEAQRALAAEMRAREQADVATAVAQLVEQEANQRVGELPVEPANPAFAERKPAWRTSASSISQEIETVLRAQESAWNEGDLESFMKHYWKSGDLTFSSGGKTTRGWDETMARYRARYPTPQSMGTVSFQDLETHALGETSAYVLGRWRVDREQEPLRGNFSLVMRQIDGRWLIVHDHTSRWEEPKEP
jgi:beta-aspartyl-peptidase (threonine type)